MALLDAGYDIEPQGGVIPSESFPLGLFFSSFGRLVCTNVQNGHLRVRV